jgi:hypothetical protein
MRGRKADPEFVSDFIRECVVSGQDTTEAIIAQAQSKIKEIDDELKAIEQKKATRSKLLDVIASFEKSISNKSDATQLLNFFKIQYPQTCKYICNKLKVNPMKLSDLKLHLEINYVEPETNIDSIFCIKQLLEAKIIARMDDKIMRGSRFDEYMKFVLCEDK